jgi:predicted oxidoreductase
MFISHSKDFDSFASYLVHPERRVIVIADIVRLSAKLEAIVGSQVRSVRDAVQMASSQIVRAQLVRVLVGVRSLTSSN